MRKRTHGNFVATFVDGSSWTRHNEFEAAVLAAAAAFQRYPVEDIIFCHALQHSKLFNMTQLVFIYTHRLVISCCLQIGPEPARPCYGTDRLCPARGGH